jgi:hypothetical protein
MWRFADTGHILLVYTNEGDRVLVPRSALVHCHNGKLHLGEKFQPFSFYPGLRNAIKRRVALAGRSRW